jgi:glutamate synthase domain-containing protein 2
MSTMWGVISYGAGTVLGVLLIGGIVFVFIRDITQKKHTVLRNYPVIGRLRYFFEKQGEYFRQYFFAGDREEMPFNRATRAWVYRLAKGEPGTIGFGSTNNIREVGNFLFVNAPFPILEEALEPAPPVLIGEGYCEHPFLARSLVNISGMSYGAISKPAVQALSRGAAMAGCWLNSGEGGVSPYHREAECDLIFQVGTAKYGIRDLDGNFSPEKARTLGEFVKAFEVKLSQGAKPGKGGILPGSKVTEEVSEIRGILPGRDSISPNRHRDISNTEELTDFIARLREIGGRPVGIKIAVGGWRFINDLSDTVLRRGLEYAPDFITVDGGEGGSGASPQALSDHMSLSIREALPRVVDGLYEAGLKERVKVVAGGKMVTAAHAAWALCVGADFVTTARGFMFALGCIQALRCHTNSCPTGVTSHNRRLQRGLVVEEKYVRVANYAINMRKEIDMIAHSCGCVHARDLKRDHVRVVQPGGDSIAFNRIHPYPQQRGAALDIVRAVS